MNLRTKQNQKLLKAFHFGIERESLRINSNGTLSSSRHPKALGSPLTHPHISTDFSEQQIEWNTPSFKTFKGALNFLEDLICFSLQNMEGELLWPFSMPCALDKIEIAKFGTSAQGKRKELYREGLSHRYGKHLQMISGIHYNFSFDLSFWKKLHAEERSTLGLQEFINEKYLGIVRNFLREGWLLTYLFGASPAMDSSYASKPPKFKKIGSLYYAPYATSIRTSHLGYYSRVQNQLAISVNDLSSYLQEMQEALTTPHENYQKIKSQLNHHLLQIANEHYSRIRIKRSPLQGESPIEALENRGIEYLEVRSIDLDPFSPLGVQESQLKFIHLFLLHCLFKKSPKLSKKDQRCLTCNQNTVALEGRKPGLELLCPLPRPMKPWAEKIFDEMEPLAILLGYDALFEKEREKLADPDKCPSARILEEDAILQGITLAKGYKQTLLRRKLSHKKASTFEKEAELSWLENKRLETASEILTEGYETLELSTQIVIKEALKRKIEVEVIDPSDQLIRLKKGNHIEYVKEATKTSKDGYVTPFLMENKEVTKKLLREKGFLVPAGNSYSHRQEAFKDYPLYAKAKVVVKPKSTNFGVGIHFISPHENKRYQLAIEDAFHYGNSILVEAFVLGEEYRFLVIDQKVIGICKREPAHIIGDGKKTIQALVHEKNHDPFYYRDPKTYLRLEKEEKLLLKKGGFTPKSIPGKGKKVFLRENSNVSTGGDAIDCTDQVHKGYHRIAVQATQALGAHICGVDMILSRPDKQPTLENHSIIEMNYNPVLFIHAYPYQGKRRDVAGPLLDLLGYS
ncbi:MAG: bifunctional glutamate--cysteine ligase GshA/glutathione synthetase GshB [Chlamydiales bacterium]|nr:bifunctional glutamate--cysteine ligase GshA/glutathione synthetase GshB [Chlamydiales bacterium]